jgi:hypothetical protein
MNGNRNIFPMSWAMLTRTSANHPMPTRPLTLIALLAGAGMTANCATSRQPSEAAPLRRRAYRCQRPRIALSPDHAASRADLGRP